MLPLEFHITDDEILKVAFAVFCGGLLGIERQYKNKTAGFRTIILISLGSALFTMVAQEAGLGVNINVITGIGFIGAGVVFKDNIGVSGLTTAAVIWVAAAIGMAAGAGNYMLALFVTLVTLFVLLIFSALELYIDKKHHDKLFVLLFDDADYDNLLLVEDLIKKHHLTSIRRQISKREDRLQAIIMVTGHKKHIVELDEKLLKMPQLLSF
ncbi:MAG TPA: MgtC/SapB family protein [Mucilaginibacter sp.]|nr:MgtC/SapB family protein [Mucilaginibacter sp.]